jgi:aldose 1-epimerase
LAPAGARLASHARLHREPWGLTPDSVSVELVTLENANGTTAGIASYGATLVRLGHGSPPADLVLGFDELAGYLAPQPLRRAAVLSHPSARRRMEVHTTSPGLQHYTGNRLDGSVRGRDGSYRRHHALCLETQRFPNAPNQPAFPSAVLDPGERFTATTEYRLFADR